MIHGKISKIYVANHRVDFRKGHNGLLGECYKMGLNPYEGDVVLFISRCRKKIKVIYSDDSGLWISYKAFDQDTLKTRFKFVTDPAHNEISTAEMSMFFEGSRYKIEKKVSSH